MARINTEMPADVQYAAQSLLEAQLRLREKEAQQKALQRREQEQTQLAQQQMAMEMFNKGNQSQLQAKRLQLDISREQGKQTVETARFLSEQEDKRKLARESAASRLGIAELRAESAERREVEKHRAWMKRERVGAEETRKTLGVKAEHGKELEEVKHTNKMELARLNNSDALKRMNKKWGLKTTFTIGREDFKAKQSKLHRDMTTGIAAENRASREEIAKKGRALQRLLQSRGQTFRSFENELNRKAREAVARLRSEGKDSSREDSVKSLRALEDMYKVMAASASGADMMNLDGGNHNDESRAYMAMMAAVGTAATEVANSGGDWKVVLKKYLNTNEVRIAIETSSEASERFATMELMLQGVSAPQIGVQGEEIPTGGGAIPTGPEQGSRREREAAGKEAALQRMRDKRN